MTTRWLLGWNDSRPEDRTGVVVYLKPGLSEKQPNLSVDVRQYAIENASFPHQTTADQWFDEAQFESYRALGRQSAGLVVNTLDVSETQLHKRALRKQKAEKELNDEEKKAVEASEIGRIISSGQFDLTQVPALFRSLQGFKPA